jgi:hypothetical protein
MFPLVHPANLVIDLPHNLLYSDGSGAPRATSDRDRAPRSAEHFLGKERRANAMTVVEMFPSPRLSVSPR